MSDKSGWYHIMLWHNNNTTLKIITGRESLERLFKQENVLQLVINASSFTSDKEMDGIQPLTATNTSLRWDSVEIFSLFIVSFYSRSTQSYGIIFVNSQRKSMVGATSNAQRNPVRWTF